MGRYIYNGHEDCLIFKTPPPPHPFFYLHPTFVYPLDLGRPISNDPNPSPNANQSIKRKHNPRKTIMFSCHFFWSAFLFTINSLILSGFSLFSFHLAQASLSPFLSLYTIVCAVVQKYHEIFFIYNYSHFKCSFCNQSVLFAQLENINYVWKNNCTMHLNK